MDFLYFSDFIMSQVTTNTTTIPAITVVCTGISTATTVVMISSASVGLTSESDAKVFVFVAPLRRQPEIFDGLIISEMGRNNCLKWLKVC